MCRPKSGPRRSIHEIISFKGTHGSLMIPPLFFMPFECLYFMPLIHTLESLYFMPLFHAFISCLYFMPLFHAFFKSIYKSLYNTVVKTHNIIVISIIL